jgi:hypothetical protein
MLAVLALDAIELVAVVHVTPGARGTQSYLSAVVGHDHQRSADAFGLHGCS